MEQFCSAFQRALGLEMDAMRAELGPYEVPLGAGESVADGAPDNHYRFALTTSNDKLVVGAECSLSSSGLEHLATLVEVSAHHIVVRAQRKLSLEVHYNLVIYPWYLYERLRKLFGELPTARDLYPENALRLFGKLPSIRMPTPLEMAHEELDASQLHAVETAVQHTPAFVWGPPGTGKTTTLSHILMELLAKGQRVLVTATTNAALDQSLSRALRAPSIQELHSAGGVLRVGRTGSETYGTQLPELRERLNRDRIEVLNALKGRGGIRRAELRAAQEAHQKLTDRQAVQQDMFAGVQRAPISEAEWRSISPALGRRWARLSHMSQERALARRESRLARILEGMEARQREVRLELARVDAKIVRSARLVMSTLTNCYFNEVLKSERFDTIVVDEAGMAVSPNLFYAACLARAGSVMVGDPKQLPAIVLSRDAYAKRALGRNIFDVVVPNPLEAPSVAMLTRQYRMHPDVRRLVSDLFYAGRLEDGLLSQRVFELASGEPVTDCALVVVDTHGFSSCDVAPGSRSRQSRENAKLAIELAARAIAAGAQSVAVITPYAAQAQLLSATARQAGLAEVECSTVHRFQGHERDVVIVDTVDTEPQTPGVLLADRRSDSAAWKLLNVSLSRARGKLILLADVGYFEQRAAGSPIANVLQAALQMGRRVSAASL